MSDIINDNTDLRRNLLEEDVEKGGIPKGLSVDELMDNILVDPLTKSSTRKALYKELDDIYNQNIRASILFIDADHFKQVNDKHGHTVGDKMLRNLAKRLGSHISRERDVIARWGGEEFVVLLRDVTDVDTLKERAEELRIAANSKPFSIEGLKEPIKQTISIGGTVRKSNEKTETWIERTDKLMYQAKESGRDRVDVAES